jgi:NAD(P)-dependent dehydrogenase (short-subunit alcohol dehydrogenase family)
MWCFAWLVWCFSSHFSGWERCDRVLGFIFGGSRFGNCGWVCGGGESVARVIPPFGRSKTANTLFAVAFDQRHRERGVRATAVHPGGLQTELARHMEQAHMEQMINQINEQAAAAGKGPFEFKTVPQGAATSVWAAVVAPAEEVGGRYCENCHVSDVVADDARLGLLDEGVRGYAVDPQNAVALWKKSEEMIGEAFA